MKKGNGAMIGLFALLVIIAGGVAFMAFSGDAKSITGAATATGGTCDGVSSVTVTYNDVDKYTPGTDPGAGNLYIVTDNKGTQAEGAITLTPAKTYKGLAGENSSGIFAEVVDFSTSCSNEELVVEVRKSGAPTITFVNDNGLTQNADATAEAVDADGAYTFEGVIKAPSKACAARYGALLIADFDKTYLSNVDVDQFSGASAPTYLGHIDISNGTSDGFKAWKYEGELCNQEKVEITGSYDVTSTAAHEDNANIVWHWLPLDYDINQDSLAILEPAAEDEDNNALTHGNTTKEFFTA